MPEPISMTLLALKGAAVLAKTITATKTAGAVVGGVKATAAVVGTATTATAIGAACVVAGGIAWTRENIRRAERAAEAAERGDLQEAARQIASLASSASGGFGDLASEISDFVDADMPLSEVPRLARKARNYAREAKTSLESDI